ncbi:MAG: DUF3168 domain-containing protein [Ahrensia sp.]
MSLVLDLHRAIITAFRSDAQLSALLNSTDSIFERVPPNRQFPCIVVEQSLAADWSTDHEPGRDVIVTVGIWSRADNRAETYAISDRAVTVLETGFETSNSLNIVLSQMLSATYTREAAQRAYRATIRLRFLIEPATQ